MAVAPGIADAHSDDASPLLRMLGLCALMLGVSLVWAIAQGPERIFATDYREPTAEELLTPIITPEVIDTLLAGDVLYARVVQPETNGVLADNGIEDRDVRFESRGFPERLSLRE